MRLSSVLLFGLLAVTGSGCFPCYYGPAWSWNAPYNGCVDSGCGPTAGPFDRRQARDMRRWYRQQNRMARRMWDEDDWPRGAGAFGPAGFGGGFDACGCGMGGCGDAMGFNSFAGDFGGPMMADGFMGGGMMMDGQMAGGFCPSCQQSFASEMPMQLGMEMPMGTPYSLPQGVSPESYNVQPTPVPQPYAPAPQGPVTQPQTPTALQQPVQQMQYLAPQAMPSAALIR